MVGSIPWFTDSDKNRRHRSSRPYVYSPPPSIVIVYASLVDTMA